MYMSLHIGSTLGGLTLKVQSRVETGWPDWAIFLPIGLHLEAFWKDEVAQNNGDIVGYFLFKQIYYIFT
jgi:hypothetical protein